MLLTSPETMTRWTHVHDSQPVEFQLWNVVRMFQHCLRRPESGPLLLSYCENHPNDIFGKSLLSRYSAEREEMIQSWGKRIRKNELFDIQSSNTEICGVKIFEVLYPLILGL